MSAQFNLRGELLANEHERKVARHIAGEVAPLISVATYGGNNSTHASNPCPICDSAMGYGGICYKCASVRAGEMAVLS